MSETSIPYRNESEARNDLTEALRIDLAELQGRCNSLKERNALLVQDISRLERITEGLVETMPTPDPSLREVWNKFAYAKGISGLVERQVDLDKQSIYRGFTLEELYERAVANDMKHPRRESQMVRDLVGESERLRRFNEELRERNKDLTRKLGKTKSSYEGLMVFLLVFGFIHVVYWVSRLLMSSLDLPA